MSMLILQEDIDPYSAPTPHTDTHNWFYEKMGKVNYFKKNILYFSHVNARESDHTEFL